MRALARSCLVPWFVLTALAAGATAQQFARLPRTHLPFQIADWGDSASGDFDGDGDLDLVVTSTCGPVRVLRNDGSGRFAEVGAAAFAPGPVPTGDAGVALGDVDGDLDLDLALGAAAAPSPTACRLFLNNGAGVFVNATAAWLPAATPAGTYSIVLRDLDGNGSVDMLLQQSSSVLVYANVGGSFVDRTATHAPAGVPGIYAMALGDVDGNGLPDLVLGVHSPWLPTSQNRMWLNTGGVFADVTSTHLPAVQTFTLGLAFGDVDGDADLDLWIANGEASGSNQDLLWFNSGSGVFTSAPAANVPVDADDGEDCELLDVDGDLDLDVVIANAGQSRCYRNVGSGVFTDATAAVLPVLPLATYVVAAGDWNGDGRKDLCFINSLEPDHVLLQTGGGTFVDGSTALLAVNWETADIAVGDFDRDGLLDLYLANDDSWFGSSLSGDHLLRNSVFGLRDATAGLPTFTTATQRVATIDFDMDGDLDIVRAVLTWPPRANVLLANNGAGVFADSTPSLGPADLPANAIAVGDVDGNGRPDLVVAVASGLGPYADALFLNSAAGFTDATATHLPAAGGAFTSATQDLVLGDVDGDGDLDLLMAASPDRLYRNQWPAPFAVAPFPANASRRFVLADVDGDGDRDVLAVAAAGGCRLYANNGAGAFTEVTATAMPPIRPDDRSLAVADVDEDGDLDIAVGCDAPGPGPNLRQNRLYLNNGLGVFTDATATRMQVAVDGTAAVAFADLDGDGDPDLVVGNRDDYPGSCATVPPPLLGTHVLVNLHRHARAPMLAQLGTSYPLQFFVEPGYANGTGARLVLPFLGLGGAPLVHPPLVLPWGALRLALPVTTLPLMILPASGDATMQFPLPLLTGFLGLRLAVQAGVLQTDGRIALTNAFDDVLIR